MARRESGKSDDKGLPGDAQELWQLVVGYAKQETIDPVRSLGRFLGFGLGGAVLLSLGTVLVLLGGLRLLQSEASETFDGRLTWVPYVIVLVLGGAVAGGALKARERGQRGRDRGR